MAAAATADEINPYTPPNARLADPEPKAAEPGGLEKTLDPGTWEEHKKNWTAKNSYTTVGIAGVQGGVGYLYLDPVTATVALTANVAVTALFPEFFGYVGLKAMHYTNETRKFLYNNVVAGPIGALYNTLAAPIRAFGDLLYGVNTKLPTAGKKPAKGDATLEA